MFFSSFLYCCRVLDSLHRNKWKGKKKKKGFSSCKCAEIRGKRIRFLVFSWKKLGRRKKSVTHIVNYWVSISYKTSVISQFHPEFYAIFFYIILNPRLEVEFRWVGVGLSQIWVVSDTCCFDLWFKLQYADLE